MGLNGKIKHLLRVCSRALSTVARANRATEHRKRIRLTMVANFFRRFRTNYSVSRLYLVVYSVIESLVHDGGRSCSFYWSIGGVWHGYCKRRYGPDSGKRHFQCKDSRQNDRTVHHSIRENNIYQSRVDSVTLNLFYSRVVGYETWLFSDCGIHSMEIKM